METFNVEVRKSNIDGEGIFVITEIKNGDFITYGTKPYIEGVSPAYDNMTFDGTKVNHSYTPNATMVKRQKNGFAQYVIMALRGLNEGEEVTIDYSKLNHSDFGGPNPKWDITSVEFDAMAEGAVKEDLKFNLPPKEDIIWAKTSVEYDAKMEEGRVAETKWM